MPPPPPDHLGRGSVKKAPARLGTTPDHLGKLSDQMGKAIPDNSLHIPLAVINDKNSKGVEPEKSGSPAAVFSVPKVDPIPEPEKPPVAPPPQPSKKKSKKDDDAEVFDGVKFSEERGPKPKGKQTLYQLMVETYFKWVEDTTGVPPVFDGGQGKAMKNITAYFLKIACWRAEKEKNINPGLEITEDQIEIAANASFGKLLEGLASGKVEPFLRNQTKATQIYSNLNNIINQLKNGTGKKQAISQTTDKQTVFNEFADRFAKK